MKLRLARPRDLAGLLALDRLAREQPARAARLREAIRKRHCLVAEREADLLGYAICDRSFLDQPFVALLFVRDSARRQRVGTALLRELEARCEGPKLFTSTNQSNEAMQRLLASLGWRPSGVILNLDPGDPELLFVRML
jgi:GNAT superfamily N-acetyltransferase